MHFEPSNTPVADPRTSNGSPVFGSEFPPYVYLSVAAAFGWLISAAWLFFGSGATDLDLLVVSLLAGVIFAILLALHRTAERRLPRESRHAFLSTQVETWTGVMPAGQAWLEVMLIPGALAVAATLIGGVYILNL